KFHVQVGCHGSRWESAVFHGAHVVDAIHAGHLAQALLWVLPAHDGFARGCLGGFSTHWSAPASAAAGWAASDRSVVGKGRFWSLSWPRANTFCVGVELKMGSHSCWVRP